MKILKNSIKTTRNSFLSCMNIRHLNNYHISSTFPLEIKTDQANTGQYRCSNALPHTVQSSHVPMRACVNSAIHCFLNTATSLKGSMLQHNCIGKRTFSQLISWHLVWGYTFRCIYVSHIFASATLTDTVTNSSLCDGKSELFCCLEVIILTWSKVLKTFGPMNLIDLFSNL